MNTFFIRLIVLDFTFSLAAQEDNHLPIIVYRFAVQTVLPAVSTDLTIATVNSLVTRTTCRFDFVPDWSTQVNCTRHGTEPSSLLLPFSWITSVVVMTTQLSLSSCSTTALKTSASEGMSVDDTCLLQLQKKHADTITSRPIVTAGTRLFINPTFI